jgi:hypothetical protein
MATSFRCAAVGCYSYESKSTHATFKELQSYLNRFAIAVGFSPIGTDGVIGASTAAAAQKTAIAMSKSGAGPQIVGMATPMIGAAATPDSLARSAEPFLAFLKVAAQAAQLPSAPAPKPGTPGAPVVDIAALPGFPVKKLNKVYVAAGAMLGLAVLIGGWQLVKRVSPSLGDVSGSGVMTRSKAGWQIRWRGGATFNVYRNGKEVDVFTYYGDGDRPTKQQAAMKMASRLKQYARGDHDDAVAANE